MNDRLFVDLRLPRPDLNLEVGSGTHAVQTAEVMRRFEPVLDANTPVVRAGRRRRQLDAGLHAGRGEEGRAGRARRSGTAQLRPVDAGRDQPRADRPDRGPPLHDRARRARQPRARGHRRVARAFRRQRDDRLAARQPGARGPAGGNAAPRRRRRRRRSMSTAGYGVVTLHRPSNVDTRGRAGSAARRAARRQRAAAAGASRCIRARAPTSSGSDWLGSCPARGWPCCRRRAISRCSA